MKLKMYIFLFSNFEESPHFAFLSEINPTIFILFPIINKKIKWKNFNTFNTAYFDYSTIFCQQTVWAEKAETWPKAAPAY